MKFGVVVIIYNPNSEIFERLMNYKNVTEDVIVIDNSDKQNINSDKLKNSILFKYYKMKGNEGISRALNLAFEIAFDEKFDYILTMDQDSNFETESIKKMLEYINENNDDRTAIFCPNYCKLYWDKKRQKKVPGKFFINKSDIVECRFSMTSASFINVELVKDVFPLDDYFIGYVDNLLCYSLIEKNYNIVMIGRIFFEQQVGECIENSIYNRSLHVIHHKNDRYYYMVRNNFLLQNKFIHNKKIIRSLRMNLIRVVLNIFLGEPQKIDKLRACKKGFNDAQKKVLGKKT